MKRIGIVGGEIALTHRNYHNAVEAAGAEAVTFTPETFETLVESVDGIVIPGGVDIDPALYREPNICSLNVNKELDRYEMAVIREAMLWSKPMLGICRGHQLLNVYFGGTLFQDVDKNVHYQLNRQDKVHFSRVEKGSYLYDLYGREEFPINSAHHQAVKTPGRNFDIIQRSADGEVEAIRHRYLPIWGVQWHPERTCLAHERPDTVNGLRVFQYFIEQCK